MSITIQEIKELAKKYKIEIQAYRHYLHAHPELSFEEINTSNYIKTFLDEHQIPYTFGWGGTGIVATLTGDLPGIRRAYRADMDALPIAEVSDKSYKSQVPGKMHACGHDVHSSSLMGAILILNALKSKISGQIDFIFQPGEEKHPGGASLFLEEGAFGKTYPEFILGQHVYPSMMAGNVGIRSGQYMASADELYFTVRGKGGHAATPHTAVDTILVAAQIITALQQVISRRNNPISPSVLTIGKINSTGGATNIIPDEVKMEGTFRAMDEKWRYEAHEHIKQICELTAKAMGATCEVYISVGYPSLINDVPLSDTIKQKMIDYLGKEQVEELPIRLTAEDFSYYTQVMPACFYRLGTGNVAEGITSPVHTPTFDIDENALEVGSGLAAWLLV